MKPLRVLYTINNLHTAGMRLVVADLVRDLDRSRFEPAVAVGRKTGDALERELERVCPILELPTKVPRHPRHRFLLRLRETARRLRGLADVAHSFDYASDWSEGVAMRAAGIPWVAEKTNLNWDDRRWWLRSCLATRIVCLSRHQQRRMARWRDKTVLIPTGVDLDAFARAVPAARAGLGADEADVLVASVAHLVPVKGHAKLVRAMAEVAAELPRLRLLFVGDGAPDYVRGLRDLASELGLGERIVFLGGRADVASILRACDAKVLATHDEGRREAFGVCLVEAMAAGLPVIATRSGGPEEIVVDGETGWLVDAEGSEPLARALRELYHDADRRARYGRSGLERARRLFGKGLMTSRYEAVYASATGMPRPRLETASVGRAAVRISRSSL